ncbi:MAG TPA: AI-2E family transporter [Thermoanaerobaculia bacterium]|nr:AI-2E family transporter [Thermoanaerobaculia bacterium]
MNSEQGGSSVSFGGRVLGASLIVLAVVALAGLLWATADVLLLTFAGVLAAIFLRSLMAILHRWTRMPWGWALLVVMLLLAGVTAAAIALAAPSVGVQFQQFVQNLPVAIRKASTYLDRFPAAQNYITSHDPWQMFSSEMLTRIGGFFTTTFGLLGAFIVIFFVGIYGAIEPEIYRESFLRLVPGDRRRRAGEVIDAMVIALKAWLNTRLFAMVVIGALTIIGLAIIGVPLALALGLIAAVLTFIPYIGPTVAAIPAILIALMQSPTKAAWVVVLSLITHTIEAYFLTPLIQKRAMSLSPIVAIMTQVLFGAIWGLLGMALATPITAVAVVLIETLYIEDTLGEEPQLGGEGKKTNHA